MWKLLGARRKAVEILVSGAHVGVCSPLGPSLFVESLGQLSYNPHQASDGADEQPVAGREAVALKGMS